jgi:hypothetical protein
MFEILSAKWKVEENMIPLRILLSIAIELTLLSWYGHFCSNFYQHIQRSMILRTKESKLGKVSAGK